MLRGVGVHRPELDHPELALVQAHPPVAEEDGPARAELDRDRDRDPERQAQDDDQDAGDEVKRALDDPVGADERGRTELEQRDALAGDVVGALGQQLGRRRRHPHAHATAVRQVDELDQRLVVEIGLGDDQLVQLPLGEDLWQIVDPAEERERQPVGRWAHSADEVIGDPPATLAEDVLEILDPVAVADEHGAAADADEPHAGRP